MTYLYVAIALVISHWFAHRAGRSKANAKLQKKIAKAIMENVEIKADNEIIIAKLSPADRSELRERFSR